eukprot:TRINITY_DN15105_c0_g1_i1.p1 TRINITY_DN15105_c0_g1~~TRINITY_DN15105_c0_g1_i1.p1  ORF type:complete len:1261 (-),score=248.56 TRINITY_DN15105_c0_g1_i1:69-3548(-)
MSGEIAEDDNFMSEKNLRVLKRGKQLLSERVAKAADVLGAEIAAEANKVAGVVEQKKVAEASISEATVQHVDDAIGGLPLMQECSRQFTIELCKVAQVRSFPQSRLVFGEGVVCQSLLVIVTGSVDITVDGVQVMNITAGKSFGESMFMGLGSHTHARMLTVDDCLISELERRDLLQVMDDFPEEREFFQTFLQNNSGVDCMMGGTRVNTCSIFKGLERTIQLIDDVLLRSVYFKGERILVEGQPGTELFMLVHGKVHVMIKGRVVMQDQELPAFFGELGLLGVQDTRTATVVAQTVSHVRVLFRKAFLNILESSKEFISLSGAGALLERRRPVNSANLLKESSVFGQAGCSEEFLAFLNDGFQERIYMNEQVIIDEALRGERSMFVLNEGQVKITRLGQHIADLGNGAVLGEITMLGVSDKRSSSVIATATCWMQVLSQHWVVQGFERFPEEREKVLMTAFAYSDGQQLKKDSVIEKAGSLTSNKEACFNVLKLSHIFSNMSQGFLESLSEIYVDRIFMPGDSIMEEGERGDSMFVMISGTAGVYVHDMDKMTSDDGRGRPSRRAVQLASEASPQPEVDPELASEASPQPEVDPEERMGSKDGSASRQDRAKGASPNIGGLAAAAHKRVRIGTLSAGSISGELAMLGVSHIRSATIEADTICSMWEITQEKGLAIVQDHPEAQRHFQEIINQHLERTVPGRIQSLPMFRGFDQKLRTTLGIYCERMVSFPATIITKDGATGNRLFVINLGMATLEKKGFSLRSLSSGGHFGCAAMLGIHSSYLCTLRAVHSCHVLAITRTSYLQALEKYPSKEAAQQLKAAEQLAHAELREVIARTITRKLILRRKDGLQDCVENGVIGRDDSKGVSTQLSVLERIFRLWAKKSMDSVQMRKRNAMDVERNRVGIAAWVERRRQAMQRVTKLRAGVEDGARNSTTSTPLGAATTDTTDAAQKELDEIFGRWPKPKVPSFYKLKVMKVLAEAVETPGVAEPLLPMLASQAPCEIGPSTSSSSSRNYQTTTPWISAPRSTPRRPNSGDLASGDAGGAYGASSDTGMLSPLPGSAAAPAPPPRPPVPQINISGPLDAPPQRSKMHSVSFSDDVKEERVPHPTRQAAVGGSRASSSGPTSRSYGRISRQFNMWNQFAVGTRRLFGDAPKTAR